MLKTQVKMLNEELPFSEKWYWREASMFNTLKCFFEVWSEQAEGCRNKTEYKNYSVMIMKRIEEYNKMLKEVKK